jgi:hypothetical protein
VTIRSNFSFNTCVHGISLGERCDTCDEQSLKYRSIPDSPLVTQSIRTNKLRWNGDVLEQLWIDNGDAEWRPVPENDHPATCRCETCRAWGA